MADDESTASFLAVPDCKAPAKPHKSISLDTVRRISRQGYEPHVPATVHGAPKSKARSKESLGRLKRMCNFDSQDFDLLDNDVQRDAGMHREYGDYVAEEAWKWIISILIGLTMGICAFCVDYGLALLNELKFDTTQRTIASSRGFIRPYLVFMTFCLMFSAAAGSLVSFVAPMSAGSGISEMKAYLNGIHIQGLMSLKTLLCKMAGVTLTMAGGMIAGKQGPFVHAGGIVGGGISGMGSQSLTVLWAKLRGSSTFKFKATRSHGGFFRNSADHRDFTAIGTAAGVATAFAAPIGGLLLTVEEGSSFYSTSVFWRGFLATCTGVVTLHFLAELHDQGTKVFGSRLGIRRDLGLYNDDVALYGKRYFYYIWELPIFALMGAAAGALGAAYIRINVLITKCRGAFIPVTMPGRRLAEVVAVSWLTGTLFFGMAYAGPCSPLPPRPQLAYYETGSDGQDLFSGLAGSERGLKHFPRLWCRDNEYSRYGQLFFTPLVQAMRMIVHFGETLPGDMDSNHLASWHVLALFGAVVYLLALFSLGIGAATGLFIPALLVGGAWGRLTGMAVKAALVSAGSALQVSLPGYAVVGAMAMLGGLTRMTLSITVLGMEGTGSMQMIVPLMLAVFVAKMVGDMLSLSIYDTQTKLRGAPVLMEPALESHQRMVADKLSAGELMTTRLVALPPVVCCGELVDTLRRVRHGTFPVTPDTHKALNSQELFDLHGVIDRATLLRLLKHRLGFFPECVVHPPFPLPGAHVPGEQAQRWELLGKLEQIPLKVRPALDQEKIFRDLTSRELAQMVDLRPFMQRAPHVVHSSASLQRSYRLFRTMGLRYLFVGVTKPKVAGILTRKDITEDNAELVLGEKANKPAANIGPTPATQHELPYVPNAYHQGDFLSGRELLLSVLEESDEDSELVTLVHGGHDHH